jgi:hypothetical protein
LGQERHRAALRHCMTGIYFGIALPVVESTDDFTI